MTQVATVRAMSTGRLPTICESTVAQHESLKAGSTLKNSTDTTTATSTGVTTRSCTLTKIRVDLRHRVGQRHGTNRTAGSCANMMAAGMACGAIVMQLLLFGSQIILAQLGQDQRMMIWISKGGSYIARLPFRRAAH